MTTAITLVIAHWIRCSITYEIRTCQQFSPRLADRLESHFDTARVSTNLIKQISRT